MRFVLDASALMAFMRDEPGGERVGDVLDQSGISSVNLSEVASRFSDHGFDLNEFFSDIGTLPLAILPFEAAHAQDAARLRAETKRAGLSLGDRACLAVARQCSATALTADRAWATLGLDMDIELIR